MFVQLQSIEHKSTVENISHSGKNAEISRKLKVKARELTKVTQYTVSRRTSSEPPVPRYAAPPIDGSLPQKKRSMIHALARVDSNDDQPNVDQQQVPGYSGMQACLNQAGEHSKAYYQSTYPEPPSKSVINDIMFKNIEGMRQKNILFLFMVGDLPKYVYIVQLKSENSVQFENIVPVLGPLHQQLSFIYSIYKRFRGLGIADVPV